MLKSLIDKLPCLSKKIHHAFGSKEDHETPPTTFWSCLLLGQVNLKLIFIRVFS